MMTADAEQKKRSSLQPESEPPIVFSEIFGNDHPVEVEIGVGKGKFLIASAEANPGTNYLGLDYAGKWMKKGQVRGEKRRLQNLKFLKGEARNILDRFGTQAVEVFHIYFPDPWPKRRHHRRRLLTSEFLKKLYGFLRSGGLIEIATDNLEYYTAIQEAVAGSGISWQSVRESVNDRLAYAAHRTSYEIKYAAENRPLYYMELKK
jgi:tRNA (guanine-N7-)-methyltransferase